MKIFCLYNNDEEWCIWEFRCKQDKCSECKLRFRCLTNGTYVNIYDTKLIDWMYKKTSNYKYHTKQRIAREAFFNSMGV